jgi:hypothetical protein
MDNFNDAAIMLSGIVAYGALKYGVVITPGFYTPGTETALDLISSLTVCVDDTEETSFIFMFLSYPELEMVDEFDEDEESEVDEDEIEDEVLDEDEQEILIQQLVHRRVKDLGDAWIVHAMLIFDATPMDVGGVELSNELAESLKNLGVDGQHSASKVVSAMQELGFVMVELDEGIEAESGPESEMISFLQSRGDGTDMVYRLSMPEEMDEFVTLDKVLAAYVKSKPGLKSNPLAHKRKK